MKFPSEEQWLYLCNILVSRWINSGKDIQAYTPKRILCVKLDEIGDVAASMHVFVLLKKRFPDAKIDVLVKKYASELLSNNPAIHKVFTSLSQWNSNYDLVVELRGNWKTMWRSFRYYPKVRLDRGLVRYQHRGKQLHEYQTNYKIIAPVLSEIPFENPQLFPSKENIERVNTFLSHAGVIKFAVIHAGARRSLRQWNSEGFARICDWLYHEKSLQIVFAGIPSEEKQIFEITEKMSVPFALFTENFSLLDLAALCQKGSLFLGNESGPLQIAAVAGIPLVGLFGPGVPEVFYPIGNNARVIHHILECNPCDQIHCVHPENPCINRISEEEVKIAIDEVLE